MEKFFQDQKRFTIGMAGRRGLGKTNLLHRFREHVLENFQKYDDGVGDEQRFKTLKEQNNLRKHRRQRLPLFSPIPTEFGEKSFLLALLEKLAQEVNRCLTLLLPPIQPFAVEQELQNKRLLLKKAHRYYLFLGGLLIIGNIALHWQTPPFSQMREQWFAVKSDSTKTDQISTREPSLLRQEYRDSLYLDLAPTIQSLQDSLQKIDALLEPDVSSTDWNFDEERSGDFTRFFIIQATWDSLRRARHWPSKPSIDSLFAQLDSARIQLGDIAAVEARYDSLQDTLRQAEFYLSESPESSIDWSLSLVISLCVILGFPIAAGVIYWRTVEGDQRLNRSLYDPMRNEIALYHRTNELLERLRYQMSFGEGQETGVKGGGRWFSFGRKKSNLVSRELRPFTTLSLIDEYRTYVQEVLFYLNRALEVDEREVGTPREQVKIVIAIDELDKVLDTQRLHEMLKSMKAIFELDHVYYLLSISEDALETYRLRHMETKNEIDSAFTHIFTLPPMEAAGSLAFFRQEKTKVKDQLLPAAVVFGGGVPRDMHRLAQMMNVREEWDSLARCLQDLEREDKDALCDLFQQNPLLSDEWKHTLTQSVAAMRCETSDEVEKILRRVERMTLEQFEAGNPCSGEPAKKLYHQVQTYVRGMAVKSFIYARVGQAQIPGQVAALPQNEESLMHAIESWQSITNWLVQLEPLRGAIFNLSHNPLGVWDTLKKNANA